MILAFDVNSACISLPKMEFFPHFRSLWYFSPAHCLTWGIFVLVSWIRSTTRCVKLKMESLSGLTDRVVSITKVRGGLITTLDVAADTGQSMHLQETHLKQRNFGLSFSTNFNISGSFCGTFDDFSKWNARPKVLNPFFGWFLVSENPISSTQYTSLHIHLIRQKFYSRH